MHLTQDLGVDQPRGFSLNAAFDPGEGLKGLVPCQAALIGHKQGLEAIPDAAFPINQCAVAIKGEGGDIANIERHLFCPLRVFKYESVSCDKRFSGPSSKHYSMLSDRVVTRTDSRHHYHAMLVTILRFKLEVLLSDLVGRW